jgi:hypothetical protein
VDGLNIVCVTANTDLTLDVGINGTITNSTFLDNSTTASAASENLVSRQTSSVSQYCLVQSYDWVGSDIIRPDCTDPANSNASQCLDPTDVPPENERLANLYPDDLLCSQCFLNMFYLRIASPSCRIWIIQITWLINGLTFLTSATPLQKYLISSFETFLIINMLQENRTTGSTTQRTVSATFSLSEAMERPM